jgi:hypothetical protein
MPHSATTLVDRLSANSTQVLSSAEHEHGTAQRPFADANSPPAPPESAAVHSGGEAVPGTVPGMLVLLELILKNRPRLDQLLRDPHAAPKLMPRLLALPLAAFTLFGVTLSIVFVALGLHLELHSIDQTLQGKFRELFIMFPSSALPPRDWGSTLRCSLRLIFAYDLGLIASAGICLPSLYFYGLLAGIPLSLAQVSLHTLKGMATTAVALFGIIPIYLAIALGAAIFQAPLIMNSSVLGTGMILPFIAGLFGMRSLYIGFTDLAQTIPHCPGERACLLRRLVISWSICYTAVTPVMIYTLWERVSRTA